MDQTILTISIPTYNRAVELKRIAALLVPQLSSSVQLHVYDNCSEIPAQKVLEEYLHLPNIKVIRNVTNIGGDANILRCYEQCTTEWSWVIGDDDLPAMDAVSTILGTIRENKEVVFINYNSNLCAPGAQQSEDAITRGQSQFINQFKSFPNLLFISTNVYRMAEIKKSFRNAYRFIASYGAQIALLLDYLYDRDAAILFSKKQVVHWNEPQGYNTRPDSVINKSLPDMLSLIKEAADRKVFFEKLTIFHPFPHLTFNRLLLSQAQSEKYSRNASATSYISDMLFINWASNDLRYRNLIKTSGIMLIIAIVNTFPVSILLRPFLRSLARRKEQARRFLEVRKFDIYRHLKEDTRL